MPYLGDLAPFQKSVSQTLPKLRETFAELQTIPTKVEREAMKPPPPPPVESEATVPVDLPVDYTAGTVKWPTTTAEQPEIVEAGVAPGPEQLAELLKNPVVWLLVLGLLVAPAFMAKGR